MKPHCFPSAALLLFSLFALPVAGLAGEIGVFLEDHPNCTIRSATGSEPCRKDAVISAGDIIRTKQAPASLSIQWLAPASTRLEPVGSGQYRVRFTPPEQKNALAMLGDLLGFVRRAGRVSHSAVTRDAFQAQPMLPGDGATLVPGQPVSFSWCTPGVGKISVSTAAGVKVREIAVPQGKHSLSAQPEELGMVPGASYRWIPVGAAAEGGRITVLAEGPATFLAGSLAQIDQGEGSAAQRGLKKAAYLQFLTENYSGAYRLGWWQYSLASELPSGELSAEDRDTAQLLKARGANRFCQ